MIGIQAQKSELQAEGRSYGPKVRVTARQTPRIRPNHPQKGPEWGLGASTEPPLLKAFLNPPKICDSGPKKPWQPETWQDSALFSPPGNRAIFSRSWGEFLTNLHTENQEKQKKNPLEKIQKKNGDGAPKLLIYVPGHGRTCPE